MAGIIKTSINLSEIPKDKIITGKKGKYLPISISVNDEPDQFGNQGPVIVDQSKEERDAKAAKTYLGNCRVVWTNGTFPEPVGNPQNDSSVNVQQPVAAVKDDLPF
jgi:hypothetical protein